MQDQQTPSQATTLSTDSLPKAYAADDEGPPSQTATDDVASSQEAGRKPSLPPLPCECPGGVRCLATPNCNGKCSRSKAMRSRTWERRSQKSVKAASYALTCSKCNSYYARNLLKISASLQKEDNEKKGAQQQGGIEGAQKTPHSAFLRTARVSFSFLFFPYEKRS